MSRIRRKPDFGWLMYSGNLGGKQMVITGVTPYVDVSVYQGRMDVTSIGSSDRLYVQGDREATITARLDNMSMVEQETAPGAGDIKALLALARRHPEEYEELREGEKIMRALGG